MIILERNSSTGPMPKWKETREDWDKQGFKHEEIETSGGLVDTQYEGENTFTIKTENVKKFSLWLYPTMVDFSKSLTVIVNGKKKLYKCNENLLDALRSYRRRRDWGLLYHCELIIDVSD